MDSNSSEAVMGALVLSGIWLLVAIGLLVWYLWAMARLFPRIGLRAGEGWIPVWNQWKLLERAGLPGWVVLLSFIGLGIVPAVMVIIAMHRVSAEYGKGAGYTVLGAFIPPLWATLLANHIDAESQGVKPGAHSLTAPIAQAAPGAPSGVAATAGGQGAPPWAAAQGVSAAAAAAMPVAPPPIPAAQAAPTPASKPAIPAASGPLGSATEEEYQRLISEGFQAPPATPLGQKSAATPFSWTAASRSEPQPEKQVAPPQAIRPVAAPTGAPVAPAAPAAPPAPAAPTAPPAPAVPAVVARPVATQPIESSEDLSATGFDPPLQQTVSAPVVPPAPKPPADAQQGSIFSNPVIPNEEKVAATPAAALYSATGITGRVAPGLLTDETIVAHKGEADLDRTVVVSRTPPFNWVLELADGTQLQIEADTIVGRRPAAVDGAFALAIPDLSRTLSKNHARLRFDGNGWTVEDLGSTNGLVLIAEDGDETELSPNQPVKATRRMLIGTLEVTLRPGNESA